MMMGMIHHQQQVMRNDFPNRALVQGAKEGSLNRNEFLYLNRQSNSLAYMREKLSADGLTFQERAYLDHMQARFDRTYQLFRHGNFHPRLPGTFNSIVNRQDAQANGIYNGLRSGSLTGREGLSLMREQSHLAGNYGHRSADGMGFFDRLSLDGQLNRASGRIFSLKHNWISDWRPSWF